MSKQYRVRKYAHPTAAHNVLSWHRVFWCLKARASDGIGLIDTPRNYEQIAKAIGKHTPPPSRQTGTARGDVHAFIDYCISSGWIA